MLRGVIDLLSAAPFRLSLFPGTRHHRIKIPGKFPACNPSIARDGDGFLVLVRTVNYRINANGRYSFPKGENRDAANWLVKLDSEFRLLSAQTIDDDQARHGGAMTVRGFQDGRPFRWRNAWWFVASARAAVHESKAMMALCRLDGSRVAECIFIPSPLHQLVEKNWMPRISEDELKLVYRVSPTQIVHCKDGGEFQFQEVGSPAIPFDRWSGSSQLIRYGGNWLCVVHIRLMNGRSFSYRHAFVELDKDFKILRYSDPWVFNKRTVEFCSGLCIVQNDAILSYGRLDREARLLSIPLPTVERLLQRDPRSNMLLRFLSGVGRLTKPFLPRARVIAVAENAGRDM